MSLPLHDALHQLAGHLRNPETDAPPGIEDRRLAIYRDLIFNNIESFIAGGFPVLKTILTESQFKYLVRAFIRDYRCHTPYFLKISEEFLGFLQQRYDEGKVEEWEPDYLLELCHYEWVELALDTSDQAIPANETDFVDTLNTCFCLSPLVWRLSYRYPVHRISPSFQPQAPLQSGCFLVVYRNREDKVCFLEVNPVVFALLQRLSSAAVSGEELLRGTAADISYADVDAFLSFGKDILQELAEKDILVSCRSPDQTL